MQKYLGILRYLAALVVVAGLLAAGGVTVQAKDIKYAHSMKSGDSLTLTDDTIINMDADLSVTQINGSSYELTILGNKTLTITPTNGYGMYVNRLNTSNARIKIVSENTSVQGGIRTFGTDADVDFKDSRVEIILKYGFGILTAINGEFNLTNSTVTVKTEHDFAIRSNGKITFDGGSVTAESGSDTALRCGSISKITGTTVYADGFKGGISSVGDSSITGCDITALGRTECGIQVGMTSYDNSLVISSSNVTASSDGNAGIYAEKKLYH
ncbi:MAG: hypothetical protein IJJ25_05365 [Lachnospiraceae bacterium]|nr:hypothetical protein [Lachnospiraceae bacterium]